MILAKAYTLEDMLDQIKKQYENENMSIHAAPGDENRWFVVRENLVLSGLHITKRGNLFIFQLI